MKIKAVILAFIFLLGGSGMSVEIAQCCSQFSGIGLSFNAHEQEKEKDCCACIRKTKKDKCCDDIIVQTVINSIPGLTKAVNLSPKQFDFKIFQASEPLKVIAPVMVQVSSVYDDHHLHDPVPVLIKKRVLQI